MPAPEARLGGDPQEDEEIVHRGLALDVFKRRRDGDAVLRLVGELDMAEALGLEDAVAGTGFTPRVFVDVRELQFIDSTGFRTLLVLAERLKRGGRELIVVAGGRMAGVLEEFGLAERLHVVQELPG
jgi:anti-anti-sigma factor